MRGIGSTNYSRKKYKIGSLNPKKKGFEIPSIYDPKKICLNSFRCDETRF